VIHARLLRHVLRGLLGPGCLAVSIAACSSAPAGQPATASAPAATLDTMRDILYGTPNGAWASTYSPLPSATVLIRGATVMTAAGEEIEGGDILIQDGKIAAVGVRLEAPAGAEVVDAKGRYVTPGIIDTHSHLGVYPSPGTRANSDGNEATDPTTAQVWALHSVWPQDPGFSRALAGGVTTAQLLPGSANLIGGRGITVKLVPARTVQDMMFPDAPMGLKMACGENPKRVYQERGPSTRMGNVAGYREAFVRAERYRKQWDEWLEAGKDDPSDEDPSDEDPPERDLELETLAAVLRGDILVHTHCYRADEMVQMINLGLEFGFKVRSFHHAVEAYKIRDYLARDTIGASMWLNWWGFKMEAFDAVSENIALVSQAGAPAILHTDDAIGIQVLNQNAARAMYAGRAAGIPVTRDEALRWITANPAWALGIEDRVGTIETGKNADLVIWSGDPFSVYTLADQVLIDGALVYDRTRLDRRPVSDFEVGIMPISDEGGGR
jgi:imidazolonepropionase-like amidohydrolase